MPGPLPNESRYAVEAWNAMGGEVSWQALPILIEMYGITDPELFITQVLAIRDYRRRTDRAA